MKTVIRKDIYGNLDYQVDRLIWYDIYGIPDLSSDAFLPEIYVY